jgi:hypothetical protein
VLAALGLAYFVLPSFAQREPGLAAERLEAFIQDLALSDQQKEQLKPILAERAQKLKDLQADQSSGRLAKLRTLAQIQRDTDAKMKPVLTEEQWEKLEAARAKAREELRKRIQERRRR